MGHYHELNVDILTQDAVYDKIFLEQKVKKSTLSAIGGGRTRWLPPESI